MSLKLRTVRPRALGCRCRTLITPQVKSNCAKLERLKMGRYRIHPLLHQLNRDNLLKELEEYGYVVIQNASDEAGDGKLHEYQEWYSSFKASGESIKRNRYLIDGYRVSHMDSSWSTRAKVRQLFGLVWGTQKLLTSVEGIVLFNPPEKGEGEFRTPDACDLYLEQGVRRHGVHAYRGAVYHEDSTEDDFCFRVLTKSHKHHTDFFHAFPNVAKRSKIDESLKLNRNERTWFFNNGCKLINVPVPKGGLLLWDARMVYDFLPPVCGRPNIDRWTCIVFVSMTPAIWADKVDIDLKKEVFEKMLTTTHWSSQGQKVQKEFSSNKRKSDGKFTDHHVAVKYLPTAALWYPCQKLMGMMEYTSEEESSNGPPPPKWQ